MMIFSNTNRLLGLVLVACLGVLSCKSTDTAKPDSDTRAGGNWHFDGFTEVRAYRMNWDEEHSFDKVIGQDGELNETRLPNEGIVLSLAQIDKLEAAVTGHHPEHPVAMCFYPHHALLFFDKEGSIIGHIDICFQCAKFEGAPEGFADFGDLDALESLFGELGMPIRNENWDQQDDADQPATTPQLKSPDN